MAEPAPPTQQSGTVALEASNDIATTGIISYADNNVIGTEVDGTWTSGLIITGESITLGGGDIISNNWNLRQTCHPGDLEVHSDTATIDGQSLAELIKLMSQLRMESTFPRIRMFILVTDIFDGPFPTTLTTIILTYAFTDFVELNGKKNEIVQQHRHNSVQENSWVHHYLHQYHV